MAVYACRIIGTGTPKVVGPIDRETGRRTIIAPADPYRAAIYDLRIKFDRVIMPPAEIGWCIVYFSDEFKTLVEQALGNNVIDLTHPSAKQRLLGLDAALAADDEGEALTELAEKYITRLQRNTTTKRGA